MLSKSLLSQEPVDGCLSYYMFSFARSRLLGFSHILLGPCDGIASGESAVLPGGVFFRPTMALAWATKR